MFEVPRCHKGFLIEPRPENWKDLIKKNRNFRGGFRPWTVGSAHQSSLYHPGVLFKEALAGSSPLKRKVHLNCDTSPLSSGYFEIPAKREVLRIDYYSSAGEQCYCQVDVPGEEKIKSLMRMASNDEIRDFFKAALWARRNSENAAQLNVEAKQKFLMKYKSRLPQIYLSRLLESVLYRNFVKSIYAKKERFRDIYNRSIENVSPPIGIKPLENGELPFRQIKGTEVVHPKALVLNIFLRLHVFDLYIQGVGESRYSIASDFIIKEFFNIAPPRSVTASLTLYYGARDPGGLKKKLKGEREKLRHMVQNPQEFTGNKEDIKKIKKLASGNIAEKKIYRQIKKEKNRMQNKIKAILKEQRDEIKKLEGILKFTSREYPFFVYSCEEITYLFTKAREEVKKCR